MAKDDEQPRLAGVIGWPIAHSLSPMIHRFWADREGARAYYAPFAVPPDYDSFARACDSLRTLGYRGVNVTLPHKEHALRYADRASARAAKAGAANMLSFEADAAVADNSDIAGFANALREAAPDLAPGCAVILGAGGAARGVLLALAEMGYGPIIIANRNRERAESVAALAPSVTQTVDWAARETSLAGARLLVNTTSLGMTGEPPLEMSLAALEAAAIVADIIYTPLETPLLAAARARGARATDGLSMLMHQAAPGYRAWLGASAEIDGKLRALLERALLERALGQSS